MKNNKSNCSKVQPIDQKPSKLRKRTTFSKNKKAKMLSIMAFCQVCKKETTKKNMIDNHYVCDCCKNNHSKDIKINNNVPNYINWEADLDYLYNNFWLCEDKL